MNSKVRDNIVHIVEKIFRVPKDSISEISSIRDLERWDSLTHMDLVLSIEEAYGIQLSLEEIMSMHTVADIQAILNSRAN